MTNCEIRKEEEKMEESAEILKLRVLLCFLKSNQTSCTVTGISRTLNKEKYVISRILAALEKDGLIDRSDSRNPVLTELGRAVTERYSERMEVSMNHLLYEGVDVDSARQDALVWSRYCTDGTMDAVRSSENRYRVKYELRGEKQFSGETVCRLLQNGSYQIPFVLYREQMKNGQNISLANDCFEHPCTLCVENGVGTVHLRAVNAGRRSTSGDFSQGKVSVVKYFQDGWFISAESSGDIYSFPAAALTFLNFGNGTAQILHGSVCLQLACPADRNQTTQVIFTMMI